MTQYTLYHRRQPIHTTYTLKAALEDMRKRQVYETSRLRKGRARRERYRLYGPGFSMTITLRSRKP